MKKALICGVGGFIGGHLAKRLRAEGYWVRGADLKRNEYRDDDVDEFVLGDLGDRSTVSEVLDEPFDEVYQLAADMGGAGYIFTGENDANVMRNSALINLHVARQAARMNVGKIFFSSSACVYPLHNQSDPDNPVCSEDSAYPSAPDSEYGWEKLFSERYYLACYQNYGLQVRIARLHNVFGPEGTWTGGKEKAPAAICRKVAEVDDDRGEIEIWGDGTQTRSFLYVDECLEGIRRLMNSDFIGPVNIGSDEMISINDLAYMVLDIAGKPFVTIKNIPGPMGVRGRNSDNTLIRQKLGWAPSQPLRIGLEKTYDWVEQRVSPLAHLSKLSTIGANSANPE